VDSSTENDCGISCVKISSKKARDCKRFDHKFQVIYNAD